MAMAGFVISSQAQVKVGFKGGVNLNNVRQDFKNSSDEMDLKMNIGFHVGPVIEVGFGDFIGIQTGALFTSKGAKVDMEKYLESELKANNVPSNQWDNFEIDGYWKFSINYIEVPINVVVKVSVLRIYVGPYVAFGVFGKEKWDYQVDMNGTEIADEKDDLKWKPFYGEVDPADLDTDEYPFSGFDYGMNFGAGVAAGPVVISGGYSMGFGNIIPKVKGSNFHEDNKLQNRVITFSVALLFGGN